jgi:hypothetical protein
VKGCARYSSRLSLISSPGCTPAMAVGVTERLWSVEELIEAATDNGHLAQVSFWS